ncbi:hypothetical protein Q4543_02430 [Salipiger sp. 1_MG-2023]|uniref:hypothetical protein n=1 Tax=Salipiger sp. 1_MG-2023 TaxID=3062665 RepID=UPI0026E1C6BC|nr:hypothetical protein [Salipiger sp. 1_MG-2023]MDO6584363.1 hypothetical protein [Salipiger sp. 1_MG-2023]
MTALKEYVRLEASALWRAEPGAQRREVIVSLGDASLTIAEFSGRALAHWSLPAVRRANKGQRPAIYYPDGDPGETLEFREDAEDMIDAIERLMRTIDKRRPKPGKLRLVLLSGVATVVLAAAVFWLPGALVRHTEKVVPMVKRDEIGAALLSRITRIAGQPCVTEEARLPLRHMALRILGESRQDDLFILPDGLRTTAHLPGGLILVSRDVLENYEDPDIVAGYILTESLRAARTDPLGDVLEHAGLWAALQLLTTGKLPDSALDRYAETLLSRLPETLPTEVLRDAFDRAQLRSAPYATALDPGAERTAVLANGDAATAANTRLVLPDADWVRLQGVCSG